MKIDKQKILQKMIRDMDPIIAGFVNDESRSPKNEDEDEEKDSSEDKE